MSELYNRIAMLCKQQGISIGKMCNQLGISRGNLTELKMERIKTLKQHRRFILFLRPGLRLGAFFHFLIFENVVG